jgi:hypothetical protein
MCSRANIEGTTPFCDGRIEIVCGEEEEDGDEDEDDGGSQPQKTSSPPKAGKRHFTQHFLQQACTTSSHQKHLGPKQAVGRLISSTLP